MKTQNTFASIFTAALAALMLICSLSMIGFAKTGAKLTVTIPFAFVAGDRQFPAGRYAVNAGDAPGYLRILNLETKSSIYIQTRQSIVSPETKAQLRFRRYGDQHFLAFVMSGTDNFGAELTKSKAEQSLINSTRDHLSQNNAPQLVAILTQAGK